LNLNQIRDYQVKVGPRLKMDPYAENFPGNDAANAMLTRDYRAPYEIPSEATI